MDGRNHFSQLMKLSELLFVKVYAPKVKISQIVALELEHLTVGVGLLAGNIGEGRKNNWFLLLFRDARHERGLSPDVLRLATVVLPNRRLNLAVDLERAARERRPVLEPALEVAGPQGVILDCRCEVQ